jgi:hypothetical protein
MLLAQDFSKIQYEATGGDFKFSTSAGIGPIISALLPYLFAISGIILLLYLIYGGFQMMLSRGDPKAVQSAQAKITSAIVGFIIIFIAYWLVQLLARVLGLSQIKGIF